ncbi:MAG TPA: hypothetical protein EYN66_21050 [Myxococcales bacterium]|nr:hypothetical protein [Myxococcales bacterium]
METLHAVDNYLHPDPFPAPLWQKPQEGIYFFYLIYLLYLLYLIYPIYLDKHRQSTGQHCG